MECFGLKIYQLLGIILFFTGAFLVCSGMFLIFKKLNPPKFKSPPWLTCIYCKGTGEREEDVNQIILMAKTQLYVNKHFTVDRCQKCVKLSNDKYDYCQEVKNQYEIFLKEYEPKIMNSMCSKCMGVGQFKILSKNPTTNNYYTQEDYEKEEKAKIQKEKKRWVDIEEPKN